MRGTSAVVVAGLLGFVLGATRGAGTALALAIVFAGFTGFVQWLRGLSGSAPGGPPQAGLGPEEETHVRYAMRFLDEQRRLGNLDQATYLRLWQALAARRRAPTGPPVAEPPAPSPEPAPPPVPPMRPETAVERALEDRSTPAVAPPVEMPPPRAAAAAPPVPPPRPLVEALRRGWDTLVSDVAVHGLAYLGVLFVFVGTLGFVIFAFGGVSATWRPVAEAVIPVVLFGSAAFLHRRGAPFVAAALQFLGGTVTPVVLFAAFVDGAGFPPDLEEGALLVTLAVLALVLAGGYAAVSHRDPTSPLRFLVAPMLWVAAGVVGLAFQRGPSAAQMAVVTWAVVATLAVARLRPRFSLAGPILTVGLPGLVVAYALTLLFAASEAWPALPMLAAGLAVIAYVEVEGDRTGWGWLLQLGAVAVTAPAVAPGWGTAPVGAATALVGLAGVERWARRAPHPLSSPLFLLVTVLGLAAAAGEPEALLVAAAVAALWAHARYRYRLDPVVVRAAAAGAWVLPAVVAAALQWRFGAGPGWWAWSAAVLAGTVLVRRQRPAGPLYDYWVPAAGAAALAAAVVMDASFGYRADVAAFAGFTLALAPRWPVLRVWSSGVALLVALLLGTRALEVAADLRPAVAASVALAAVVAAIVWARPPAGHLALLGHAVGAGSLVAAGRGWVLVTVLAAWVAGWGVEVAAEEVRGRPLVPLLARPFAGFPWARRAAAALAPTVAWVSFPFLVAEAATMSGLVPEGERGRMGLLLAGTAIFYGAIARSLVARRPLAPVMATGGVLVAAVAIAVAAPEPWPTIAAVSTSIAVVAFIGGRLRRPAMTWFAWAVSAVLALLLADRAGVAAGSLHLVLLGWGGVLLVGGLAGDEVTAGRRSAGEGIRTGWLVRPVALGALGVPVALAFAFASRPPGVWPWAAVAAGIYLLVALQLRAGSVTTASYALLTLGLGAWAEDTVLAPLDHPWVLVLAAGVLLAVGFLLAAVTRQRDPWLRWDAAPVVVAHLLFPVAVAAARTAGSVPAVWAGFGALALVLAAWKRHWAWAASGAVLVLVGAGAAGHGWLALALAGTAVAALVAARMVSGWPRRLLQWLSPALAGWAWVETVIWADWWPDPALQITPVAGGILALGLSAAVRWRGLREEWWGPWATLAALAVLATVAGGAEGARTATGLAVAAGLALWAAAAALAAAPLGLPGLRFAAAVLALAAGGAMSYALQPPLETRVAGAVAAGAVATLAALAVWRWGEASPWLRPLLLFAAGANAAAVVLAATAWPRRSLLVAALGAAGLEALVAGLVMLLAALLYAAPLLLVSAWLVFASEGLTGNAQWFTVPIGVAVLAVVEVARWDRRRRGRAPSTPELEASEYAGMAFVVGAALLQIVTRSAAAGLVAMLLATGLGLWGITTRVRRRVYVAAGSVALAAFLMVAVPVARIIPEFRGVALWATVGAIGVVLIGAAVAIERGRARLAATVQRLDELMEGWE